MGCKYHWEPLKKCECQEKPYNQDDEYDWSSSKAIVELRDDMRRLWQEHVIWTRLTIISMIADLPDLDATTKRLLRNPQEFEAVLEKYYGHEDAHMFSILMRDHLLIAGELVQAAKAGNNKAVAAIEKKWYANADEIAYFLHSINCYWQVKETMKMWHEHLALTKAEAVAIITGNYMQSINLFDEIENQAFIMADDLVEGIVNQFPEAFV